MYYWTDSYQAGRRPGRLDRLTEWADMAITLRTRILVWATADGESTSFVFDLFKSQFWIGTARPSGFGGHSPNFFTERAAQLPSGVVVVDGAESALLLNTMITVQVPVQPEGH